MLASVLLLGVDGRSVALDRCARNLRLQVKLQALLGQALLEQLAHLLVGRGNDARQELEDGYLGTQPLPDRAQLETDVAGADDDQVVGDLREGEGTGRIDDRPAVKREKWQLDRL